MVLEQNDYNKVKKALYSFSEKDSKGCFLYVFLGNISLMVSSYGEEYSDNIVSNLITSLKTRLGEDSMIFRVDKEHLNIIVNKAEKKDIDFIVSNVHSEIINYSSENNNMPVQFSSNIGVTDFSGSLNPEEIINCAHASLVEAKEKLLNYLYYEDKEKYKSDSKEKLTSANYFHNAFLEKKLRIVYQPIFKAATGEVEYYECLLRILNEDKKLVSAGPFIPVAEKMGLIGMIDDFVFTQAVKKLEENPDLKLSVNVSNNTIQNSKWLENTKAQLQDKSLASRLLIEITETFEQNNIQIIEHFISSLHELGCKVALDDFGSGYTSFSQLKNFAFDVIKIDGSFVKDLADNEKDRFIVKALLDYSNNFGISTVAEFVENQETVNVLKDMNIDLMQGYYLSPAISSPSFPGYDRKVIK